MRKLNDFMKHAFPKLLLTGAMLFTCLPAANIQAAGEQSNEKSQDLKIFFDEPVSQGTLIPGKDGGFHTNDEDNHWQQLSLPIGNSAMGANVYGEVGKEHLTFNQKTLWNGGPSESRPDYNGGNKTTIENMPTADYVKKVQEKLLNGDLSGQDDAGKIIGLQDGYGAYQSFGDIYLDFGLTGTVENYERALDLDKALATVDFTMEETSYHREFLASYPDDVIAMKVTAEGKDKLNFDVTFPIDNDTTENLKKSVTTTAKDATLTVKGMMNDNQMKLNGQLKVVTPNGTIVSNGDRITVHDASEATIFLSASTDYKDVYPNYRTGESDEELNQRVRDVVNAAADKGYEEVKASGTKDYKTIFDRVALDLGQSSVEKTTDTLLTAYNTGTATEGERRAIEVLLFQYGRYLQIASSRDGDLPANLQGVWNNRVGDANRVPWGSDYHMNVNLQMNYWPTYSTNMAECATPLIDYVNGLREPGRVTAETYFGVKSDAEHPANGFSAHTQNTPFGWTCPGWIFSWGWSPAAVPWILQNCYEYYEYTGDLDYLKSDIYPTLKEEAIFYQQILKEDPATGRMVSVPSFSPEQGPITAGNTYEQSLVWQLMKDVTEAADALGVDQDLVKEWKALQAKLKPIEIGSEGQIKEWYEETTLDSLGTDVHHRHMSHLLGLFPGDLISVDNQEYLDAAIYSLTKRGDDATGWGMGQRLNSWARVGDGTHAYAIIKAFFQNGAYPNLWDAHAPFQIDGNFGYTSGVAEMLMQSNMGYINLLPAMPDDWGSGSVEGLVARGNFELSMDWNDGNLTAASILSKNGNDCTLAYPNIDQVTIKQDGKVIETTKENGKISFPTAKGKTYTVENFPARTLKAVRNPIGYTDGKQTLLRFDEHKFAKEYQVYKKVKDSEFKLLGVTKQSPYRTAAEADAVYMIKATNIADMEGLESAEIIPVDISGKDKLDDRDKAIAYSSGWGNWEDAGQYQGTEKYTDNTGSTLEFCFSGNGLRVIGMKTTNCHTYDLYIDGVKVEENVDTNASTTQRQAVLSETLGLSSGIHQVKLVVTQAKISLDAFEFISDGTPEGMSIVADDVINIAEGNRVPLAIAYTPAGTKGGKISWSVENDLHLPSNIAAIDAQGVLTITHPGTIIVTAEDKENDLQAVKEIQIVESQGAQQFDDRDKSIQYSEGWSTWNEDKHQFGTVSESTQKDASFTFSFTGSKLALYFMKLEAAGGYAGANIGVMIDDESQGIVSTFTTVKGSEPKSKVFESKDLKDGMHTAKVTVLDCPLDAPQGSKPKVSFDYYEVVRKASAVLDYTTLKAELLAYQATDLSLYTLESAAAYTAVFETNKELYEAAATQEIIEAAVVQLQQAREALRLPVDKSALEKAVHDSEKLIEEEYTSESWASFVSAKAHAVDILQKDVDQDQINEALAQLQKTIADLKLVEKPTIDKTILQQMMKDAIDKEAKGYVEKTTTASSWKAYQKAYAQADALLQDPTASQETVDQAAAALKENIQQLTLRATSELLQKLQESADALRPLLVSDSPEEIKDLLTAMDALLKEAATQPEEISEVEVQALLAKVTDAKEILLTQQARSDLKALLKELKGLEESDYTKESWKNLVTSEAAAQAVLEDTKATRAQLLQAYGDIQAAKAGLQRNDGMVDKTILEKLVYQAEQLLKVSNLYTPQTVKQLQSALAAAKQIIENADAEEEAVKQAENSLREAIAHLEKLTSNPPDKEQPSKDDPKKTPANKDKDTADTTNLMMWYLLLAAGGCLLIKGYRKIKS